ncbi:MAG: hypothetical protein WC757_02825 [Candidatus Paceibacterota bacterium]|jgi:hypothetical protein
MQLLNLPLIPGLVVEQVGTLLTAVKDYAQFKSYVDNLRGGVCPFCDPYFSQHKDKDGKQLNVAIKTIGDGQDAWRMWNNPFPIRSGKTRIVSAETHLVIAPVRHITSPNEMTGNDWMAWTSLIQFALTDHDDCGNSGMNLPGGGVLMRFGDPSLNAGSVLHIHTNIIVPNLKGEARVPLAKEPEDVAENVRILHIFSRILSLIEAGDAKTATEAATMLLPAEQATVQGRLS